MDHSRILPQRIHQLMWCLTLFLVPIAFFPFALDPFNGIKQIMITGMTLGMLILYGFWLIRTKKITVVYSPVTVIWGLFTLANILGLIGTEHNILTAWVHPMGIMTFLSLFVLHVILMQWRDTLEEESVSFIWPIVGATLSGITILWFSGLYKLISLPMLNEAGFTPLGDLILQTAVICICAAITGGLILAKLRQKNRQEQLLLSFAAMIMIAGVVINVFQLMTSNKPVLMPYQTGWTVALKGIEIKPILGIGLTHYEDAFIAARPANINLTPIWNIHFSAGPNLFFHYLAVLGIAGALLVVALWYILLRAVVAKPTPLSFGLGILLLYTILFPPTITILFFLFALSALVLIPTREVTLHAPSRYLLYASILFPAILFLVMIVSIGSVILAEHHGWKALNQAGAGNLRGAYNEIHQANSIVPYRSDYQIMSSRLTLAVASSILSQKELSQTDQQQAITLVDQAITEGKRAIELSSLSATAWQNLAEIYQNLIPTFSQADIWALSTYDQVVARDPVNPLLRSNAAVILDYQGNLDQAVQALETAIALKPDYTLARYALATGYVRQQRYPLAASQYSILLQLLPPNTEDAKKVEKDLKTLQDFVADKSPQPTPAQSLGSLVAPDNPLEASQSGTKLPLTQEAAPPSTKSASN